MESHLDNKKFYVPDITEFHIGFEYESLSNFMDGTVKTKEDYNNAVWRNDYVKSIKDFPYIERALTGQNANNGFLGLRVKYLDKADIESLGWVLESMPTFKKDTCQLIFNEYNHTIQIFREEWESNLCAQCKPVMFLMTQFKGVCKNKSELKRLMKQLGINE